MPTPLPLTPTTTLRTVVTATLSGNGRTNQDHTVVTDHAMAVLDGATSWLPQDPARDGGWYARTLGAALTARLDDDVIALAEIVAAAITELRDTYGLRPGDCPTSTVTIARWTADDMQLYTLGDSPAVIYPRSDTAPILFYDNRLESVGATARAAYRAHLRAGHGYDERLAELVATVQLAERDDRNRAGGYWIPESDPTAAGHGLSRTHPCDDLDAVILLSDGAAATVMDYQLSDWPSVLDGIRTNGPGAFLRDTHAQEQGDSDGIRWPRAKRHDDKTVVVWA